MKNERLGRWLLWGNCLTLVVFYLGLDILFRRWDVDTFTMLFWGYLGVVVICAPWFLPQIKRMRTEIVERKWLILAFIVTAAMSSWLWVSAIGAAGSGPVSLIENTQTLFAVGLGFFFLGEKLTRRELFAGIIILGGVVLVGTLRGEVPLWAAIATVAAAFIFALQSFLIKKFGAGMHSSTFSYLRSIGLAVFFTVIAFAFDLLQPLPWEAIILTGFLYILGAVIARYFFFEAHKHLSISQINLLILVIPVMVLTGTFFLFDDLLSLQKIIGTILVLGGASWFVHERNRIEKNGIRPEESL